MSDEEQEVFHRPSLDDNEGDNDEESEEEIGTNRMNSRRDDDDDEEEEEEIIEATDDELLNEIKKDKELYESQKAEFEKLKEEMLLNGSLSINDTYTFELNGTFNGTGAYRKTYQMPGSDIEADGTAQLTEFQENIITTGSGASIALLVILLIMFIIQCVRKLYDWYINEKIESNIDDVLVESNPTRAEDHTMDATSYIIYNTPFDEREHYEKREREGADLRELQQILEQRAIRVILRGTKIQEDSQGIKKNWQLDMVPRPVWDDFCAAQANVQKEFELIVYENEQKQFDWGPKYKNNILQYAKEKIQYQKKKQYIEHMQRQQRAANYRGRGRGRGRGGGMGRGGGGGPPGRIPGVPGGPPGGPPPVPTAQSMIRNVPPGRTGGGPSSPNRDFGKGFSKGFLNQKQQRQPKEEKLTRRQKKKLKQQQAQQQQNGPGGQAQNGANAAMYPTANEFNPQSGQQTNPQRRKKGGRRRR